MFRKLDDFYKNWKYEAEATVKIFSALTDESLSHAVNDEHRSLGRMACHITQTIPEMLGRNGLKLDGPAYDSAAPTTVAELVAGFQKASDSLIQQIRDHWTDDTLLVEDDMYGEMWARGFTLTALIMHQSHHRGQMTVLMRQAGLKVPGIYGPSLEEWVTYGAPAPAV